MNAPGAARQIETHVNRASRIIVADQAIGKLQMSTSLEQDAAMSAGSRLQARLDALPSACLALTDQGRIVHANPAALHLFGVDNAHELTDCLRDWFDTAILDDVAMAGPDRLERVYRGANGRDLPVQIRLHGFHSGSAPDARFLVMIDQLDVDPANIVELEERQRELEHVLHRLHDAQDQLLQSDKLASIGQLAAGVAHEINNPIGYIHSNLGTLSEYLASLFRLNEAYEAALRELRAQRPKRWSEIEELKQSIDYSFLITDLPQLLSESREGIERVRKIVEDLRDFSRAGFSEQWAWADLHKGLDSTLNIVWNDLKYKCEVHKQYGKLPPVECLPSQLNQVFLNILVNAGHAIEQRGTITITTGCENNGVFVDIADSGKGIAAEDIGRIFDPFFTTKPVGQGTGLGLSLSYSIVRKHGGRIDVDSKPGVGTTFRVFLPREQPRERTAPPAGDTESS